MGDLEVDKQIRSQNMLGIQTEENNQALSQNDQIATPITNNKDQTKFSKMLERSIQTHKSGNLIFISYCSPQAQSYSDLFSVQR